MKKKIFIQYFWINTLTFNILEHKLVPNHIKVNNSEVKELLKIKVKYLHSNL